jgi:hypothetical protein
MRMRTKATEEEEREGMKANKAFRKFGRACMNAPSGASLVVGLVWIETKGWRVVMNVHNAVLHLGAKDARGLANVYDRQHQSPEWRGRTTGLEWVAPELRKLADEVDEKNAAGFMPPEMLDHVEVHGNA